MNRSTINKDNASPGAWSVIGNALRASIRGIVATLALIILVTTVASGVPRQGYGDPPSDRLWLWSLFTSGGLLLLFFWLPKEERRVSMRGTGVPLPPQAVRYAPPRTSLDPVSWKGVASFERAVTRLRSLLLVGLFLLTSHLFRQQLIVQPYIERTHIVRADGVVTTNPRQDILLKQVCRGDVYAGDELIAASVAITSTRYCKREYRNPDLSYLVGYWTPGFGAYGIEESLDSDLTGLQQPEEVLNRQRDWNHRPIVGNDLHLTIVPHLQKVAQEALGTRTGAVVVLDAWTGAIISLASYPHIYPSKLTFDPGSPDWSEEFKRIQRELTLINAMPTSPYVQRATMALVPPGSQWKLLTSAAALEEGLVSLDTVIPDENGWVVVPNGGYRHTDCPDCRPSGHAPYYTLTECYIYSLNTCFARLAAELGPASMESYMRRFGVGMHFNLGVPSEVSLPYLKREDFMDQDVLASTGYGQGELLVSPLQVALMHAAVLTGGEVPEPFLVSYMSDPADGHIVQSFVPHMLQRAVSPEVAAELKKLLLESVRTGWAKNAAIDGYTVGGKSGTAQFGDEANSSHAWFTAIGGTDEEHMRYVVTAFVEKGGEGLTEALPIAKTVLKAVLESAPQPILAPSEETTPTSVPATNPANGIEATPATEVRP
ncbi:MAG TPA: penicillin-binding transpeptidase domain-containing protein [Chloroflexia bacterium]|nr:penicillin-binding transpeptidase domain-containing protein [Chloroflexia bacterium]